MLAVFLYSYKYIFLVKICGHVTIIGVVGKSFPKVDLDEMDSALGLCKIGHVVGGDNFDSLKLNVNCRFQNLA